MIARLIILSSHFSALLPGRATKMRNVEWGMRNEKKEAKYQFSRLKIISPCGGDKSVNSVESGGQVFHALNLQNILILPRDIDWETHR
jgi:hypothetical protein